MVWFGQFWRGILHHTYRVRFHPMFDHISLLEGKNWSTLGAVNLSSSVRFIRLYGLDSYVVECKKEEKNG